MRYLAAKQGNHSMKLYFVRHGESEANLLNEFSNRGWKHPLTARGRQQAETLAQKLVEIPITALYTSPLRRAVETAQVLARALGIEYTVTDALREYDCGILEGRSDQAGWDMYSAVLDDWLERGLWARRIEGGESFLEMQTRFVPFVEGLTAEHGGSPANIVLVGHGGLYRCMLLPLLTNVDFKFARAHPIGNTGYALAEKQPEGLVCVEWT